MIFENKNAPLKIFRRDWGNDRREPISKWRVALDAITPSSDDCTMRVIFQDGAGYSVSIARYSNIYFAGVIMEQHHITLTKEVVEEIHQMGFLIPFSFISAPNELTSLMVVSDLGEECWRSIVMN